MCLWIKNNAFGMIRRCVSSSIFRTVDRKEINKPLVFYFEIDFDNILGIDARRLLL